MKPANRQALVSVYFVMHLTRVLRRLVRFPAFTAVAIFTLAIGIGANSAIFAVVYGVLLKPLPYPHADDLVSIDHSAPGVNIQHAGAAPFLYFTYRDRAKSFTDIGMWQGDTVSVTGVAAPEEIPVVDVTDGVLRILGVTPVVGRLFTRADDAPGSPETTVLSYGYWQARFGGQASAIGRRVMFDGRAREIIGVLPPSFRFLDRDASAFVPMRLDRGKTFLGNFSFHAIGRLAPGVTLAGATADMARLIPVAIKAFPPFPGFSEKMFAQARLAPATRLLRDEIVGDVGRVLWVLMGTIGMVLLIACANVTNLLLVRTQGRQQELAVRAALGAGWARIARDLVAESLVLGACGGAAGLALAYGGLRVLAAIAPANLPRLGEIAIGGPVVLFTVALSLLAGAVLGAIPALKYAGPNPGTALRVGGRTLSQGRDRHRARNTLVVVQVALALVLLIGSGLMIRTFQALRRVDPGFTRPAELLTLRITIPSAAVKEGTDVLRMQQSIADKIGAIPGVASVGLTTVIPMDGQGWTDPIFAADKTYAEGIIPPLRRFKFITPGLLETMGNRVVAGRDFSWEDLYGKRRVAIVSENLARELWREPSAALGKRVRETLNAPWREVVGVVTDERDDGVDQKPPTFVCWPMLMEDFGGDHDFIPRVPAFVIRSLRAGSSGFVGDVSRAVWSVNPDLALASVRTQQEIYSRSLARTSFMLVMLSIAGVMALLLGVAGIYGVISYTVSQRVREIGIRVALGARRQEVTRLFVAQALRLAVVGITVGLGVAIGLTRLLASLLFGVAAVDPLTYLSVSLGLVISAVLAGYVPALRATSVNPVEALRAE
jgi:putative ABC transport system permease protein